MELGFVTAILHDLSLEEVLAFAESEGYQCIEALCWPAAGGQDREYGGVCHVDVEGMTQDRADDIRALCDKYHVGISALGYYANALSHDTNEAEYVQNHFRKVIDAAQLFGLNVNGFIGADRYLALEENLKKFEQVWPDMIRYAEDRNVKVAIENCPMLQPYSWPFGWNLARTPSIWRRMFEVIPSANFGLNYDPSHLVMQLMDPIAPIREFGDRIFHTHAKDMRIDRHRLDDIGSLEPPMLRSTAKIPGLGDVDWGQWIGALTDVGYNGPVCVEVEDEAFEEDLAARKRSLTISRKVLQALIA